jgi:hypothetical protein
VGSLLKLQPQSFVGGTALLIIHVSSVSGAVFAQCLFEIAFQFVGAPQSATRSPVVVLFLLQNPLQFSNGGVRIIFLDQQPTQ